MFRAHNQGLDHVRLGPRKFNQFVISGPVTLPTFGSGDWDLVDAGIGGQLDVAILTLPTGTTDIEYSTDAGETWTGTGGVVGFSITGLPNAVIEDVTIRPVRSGVTGNAGDTKQATPTGVPGAFSEAAWELEDNGSSGTLRINILTLPSDRGKPISDIEYKVGAGAWISSGETGTFFITGQANGVAVSVQIRAVNDNGAGAGSDVKNATPTAAAQVPAAFTSSMWTATDVQTGGSINIGILSLPNDNGSAIIDIDYRIEGGTAVSSGGTTSFNITGLTDDAEVDVELRAVNAVGDGPWSDVKARTPTTLGLTFAYDIVTPQDRSVYFQVGTNADAGTLFTVVVPTAAAAPLAAQVAAGQNGSGGAATLTDSIALDASDTFQRDLAQLLTNGQLYDIYSVIKFLDDTFSNVITQEFTAGTAAPVNTVLPAISGTTTVGETLSATTGTWTGSPSSYAYQWYADDVGITGATGDTYELDAAEEGADITVGVVATNGIGASAEAVSDAVGPVAPEASASVLTITSVTANYKGLNAAYTLTGASDGTDYFVAVAQGSGAPSDAQIIAGQNAAGAAASAAWSRAYTTTSSTSPRTLADSTAYDVYGVHVPTSGSNSNVASGLNTSTKSTIKSGAYTGAAGDFTASTGSAAFTANQGDKDGGTTAILWKDNNDATTGQVLATLGAAGTTAFGAGTFYGDLIFKKNSGDSVDRIRISLTNVTGGTDVGKTVDISTTDGSVISNGFATAPTVTSLGNGWFQVRNPVSLAGASDSTGGYQLAMRSGLSATFPRNGTNQILLNHGFVSLQ